MAITKNKKQLSFSGKIANSIMEAKITQTHLVIFLFVSSSALLAYMYHLYHSTLMY